MMGRRWDSLSARDFASFDPWDVALEENDGAARASFGEFQRRYRLDEVDEGLGREVAFDEEGHLRRRQSPVCWYEVPISPVPAVPRPIPICQGPDVEDALHRDEAYWERKRRRAAKHSRDYFARLSPERREILAGRKRAYDRAARIRAREARLAQEWVTRVEILQEEIERKKRELRNLGMVEGAGRR